MAGGDVDLADTVGRLLSMVGVAEPSAEVEAYASRNILTMARIESLTRRGGPAAPSVQQLKCLEGVGASIKVVMEGAVGQGSTRDLSPTSLERMVGRTIASAKGMSPDPNFVSLARPVDRAPPTLPADPDILAGVVEGALADAAEDAIASVDGLGLELAGSIMAVGSEVAVINSLGIELSGEADTFIAAQFTVERMEGPKASSSGMGWSTGRVMDDLDAGDAAAQAVELGAITPELSSVPEGEYNVILGEYAVADVLDNLMPYVMDLGNVYRGVSWLPTEHRRLRSGKEAPYPGLGGRVAVEGFHLQEDPTMERGMLSHSHDDEGLPSRRVDIIRDGVFEGVMGSSYWSYLYDMEPTGSALRRTTTPGRCAGAPPRSAGTNLVVSPGDMTLEEMVEASEGPTLYIPRTWYTYPTRFGAPGFSSSNRATSFLVEGGELLPVKPNAFKLTGDMLGILGSIYAIGREQKTATTWVAMRAPVVPMIACRGIRVSKPVGEA